MDDEEIRSALDMLRPIVREGHKAVTVFENFQKHLNKPGMQGTDLAEVEASTPVHEQ